MLIRPYIHDLTTSELHAVMTAGFGTIAGSVLAAYFAFGVGAAYKITRNLFVRLWDTRALFPHKYCYCSVIEVSIKIKAVKYAKSSKEFSTEFS